MASASRRGRVGPKHGKMTVAGRTGPERFHYCREHDVKLKAEKMWGGGMVFQCPQGCRLEKSETHLK